MQEFFTWNSLLTSSGATVATSVVTQLIKEAPLLKKIPTRLLSFGIALCILMLALIFNKSLSLGTAAISVINAAVVALAANGMFDAVSSGMGKPGSGQGGDSESAEPNLPDIADNSDGSTADGCIRCACQRFCRRRAFCGGTRTLRQLRTLLKKLP